MASRALLALAAAALAVCTGASDGDAAALPTADTPSLVHVGGDAFAEVVRGNDAWAIVVIAPEHDCARGGQDGRICQQALDVFARTAAKADGLMRFGYLLTTDTVGPTADGEFTSVASLFNVTTIPEIFIYGVGPRLTETPIRIAARMASMLVTHGGPRGLYENLRHLIPNLVSAVRGRSLGAFLSTDGPRRLPRVLLVSHKTETPAVLRKLALDFASRAVFGLARAADKDIEAALLPKPPKKSKAKDGEVATPTPTPAADGGSRLYWGPPVDPTWGLDGLPPKHALGGAGWKAYNSSSMGYSVLREWLHRTLPPVSATSAVPLLRSAHDFDDHCAAPGVSVCFIGILPSSALTPDLIAEAAAGAAVEGPDFKAPAKARTGLAAMYALASRLWVQPSYDGTPTSSGFPAHRMPMAFAVMDGEAQADFAAAFDVAGGGPALLALNPRKKAFALLQGSIDEDSAMRFILPITVLRSEGKMEEEAAENNPGLAALVKLAQASTAQLRPVKRIPPLVTQLPPEALMGRKAKPAAAAAKERRDEL